MACLCMVIRRPSMYERRLPSCVWIVSSTLILRLRCVLPIYRSLSQKASYSDGAQSCDSMLHFANGRDRALFLTSRVFAFKM